MNIQNLLSAILVIIGAPCLLTAQDYCNSPFNSNDFGSIQKTTMKYGRAKEATGYIDSIDLFLDLYYSEENTNPVQPIMFLLHGGSYITELGDKSNMEEFARIIVPKGFVVVSIDYSTWSYLTGGVPSFAEIVDVAVKAMLDLQTAIDFVVVNSGKGDFPEVDLQHMIIGGGSSGAITINHRLYLDANDSIPGFLADAFENNGGIYESTSDKYKIVYGLNMSGGILDTTFIDPDEPPLISVHGNKDSVVFYDYGLASGVLPLYGSKAINERLQHIGTDSYLYTFEGGGHSNIYSPDPMYRNTLLKVIDTGLTILEDALCLTTHTNLAVVEANVQLVNTLVDNELIVENNESESMSYDIVDLWGRKIQSGILGQGHQRILLRAPAAGYFAFRVYGQGKSGQVVYQQLFYSPG